MYAETARGAFKLAGLDKVVKVSTPRSRRVKLYEGAAAEHREAGPSRSDRNGAYEMYMARAAAGKGYVGTAD